MLIPSYESRSLTVATSLSRRVNANSQPARVVVHWYAKLIKKGEC